MQDSTSIPRHNSRKASPTNRHARRRAFFETLEDRRVMASNLINFDNLTAPDSFDSQIALASEYASQGVEFGGVNGVGWEVLNEAGGFGVAAASSPNFLAWNTELTGSTEKVTFAATTNNVSLQVGSYEGGNFTATAFDANGNSLGSDTVSLTEQLQSVSLPYSNIASVELSTTAVFGVLDNLSYDIAQNAPATPISASLDANGNLTIADSESSPNDNLITLSSDGTYLILSDPRVPFAAAPTAQSALSNNGRTLSIPLSQVTGSITVLGGGGDDTLSVDYATSIANTINFDGGSGGFDTLSVRANADTTYAPSATIYGDGTIEHGGSTINFFGLEPVDFDFTGPSAFTLTLPGADDIVDIANGTTVAGGLAALILSGSSGGTPFETAHVRGASNVIINTVSGGTDGNDAITISSANNAHNNTALTISTGTGTDTVMINGATSFTGSVSIDTVNVSSVAAGTINAGAGLTITNTGTASGSNSLAGDITGSGGLTKLGAGTLFLTSTNSSYSGTTIFTNGIVNIASIANFGANSSL